MLKREVEKEDVDKSSLAGRWIDVVALEMECGAAPPPLKWTLASWTVGNSRDAPPPEVAFLAGSDPSRQTTVSSDDNSS